jgi:LEA14-like dessication related protein
MIKKLILAVVALVIVIVAAGGIAYATGMLRPPELEGINLSWGEVTPTTTTVHAIIQVNNRLPFGLGAEAIGIKIPVYFYNVQAAEFNLTGLSLPSGSSTLEATATIIQAKLPQWWPDFVNQGGLLFIHTRPSVSVNIFGIPLSIALPEIRTKVSIPIIKYMGSKEPMTMGFDDAPLPEIARNPGAHFTSSSPPPVPARPVLTVESWELHWGNVTIETTQVLGTVVLRNELPVPIPIQGLRLGLDVNEIRVVPDVNITPTQPVLPPGESVPMALEANVDNEKLVQWWTSHLQREEETVVTARIGMDLILPEVSGFGFTEPILLPLVPIPAFECKIQTDIMGVANHQIAQMLGRAVGPKPEAVKVEFRTRPPQLGPMGPIPILLDIPVPITR